MARNHFRLGAFAGTGRAEKNESSFHSRRRKNRQQRAMAEYFNRLLSAVKEKGDPGNNEHGDADIKPHKRAAPRRFAATVGRAIK